MRRRGHALVSVLTPLSLWCLSGVLASAADPEIDGLLTGSVGKDW